MFGEEIESHGYSRPRKNFMLIGTLAERRFLPPTPPLLYPGPILFSNLFKMCLPHPPMATVAAALCRTGEEEGDGTSLSESGSLGDGVNGDGRVTISMGRGSHWK